MNKKKYLIIGSTRTGTNRVKELIYKNFNKKYTFSLKKFHSQYIFFNKNKNYFFLNLKKKNNLSLISKKKLREQKILSTHNFSKKIIKDFNDYNLILTIRNPLETIASLTIYNTKKNILSFNPNFKIKSPIQLAYNKRLIKKYINIYNNLYLKILKKNFKKFTICNFDDSEKLIAKKLGLIPYKLKKQEFHMSKNKQPIIDILKKNYNFKESFKIYNSLNI